MSNTTTHATGFQGARVVIFESRMADAMAKSVASHGGVPVSAPSMQEVPLTENRDAFRFAEELLAGRIELVIFMTGVGTRYLLETLATRYEESRMIAALSKTTVVARGPKPIRVLKEYGIPVTITVPEPNTWHEIVHTLDLDERSITLQDRTVAIQEYGVSTKPLIDALVARGARVIPVPVYRWALPNDLGPLRDAIREILDGGIQFALFTNAVQVRHLIQIAADQGVEQALRQAFERIVVASIGPTTSDALTQAGLSVDVEPSHSKMGPLIDEVSKQAPELLRKKLAVGTSIAPTHPTPTDTRALRAQSLFLKACRREPTPTTPVWLMRQAGRYMAEYRELRRKVSFLELCKRPELVAEVTVTAAEKIHADAAILFSDILLIVEPLGLALEYHEGEGPIISGEVATGRDVDRLAEIEPAGSLQFVFDGVRHTRAALQPTMPLIGFSGAPFTLASYIIEGGTSKSFLSTKRLMYTDSGAWHALMQKISRGLIKYLNGQIAAGVDALQLFDTWVGCLGPEEYREYVLPHTQAVIRALKDGTPVIHFGTGTGSFLKEIREAGGDVIGVDSRVTLEQAWQTIGDDVGIQGNLDPVVLYAPIDVIRKKTQQILAQAAGRPGHIFNLGHGVLPTTPVDHVIALVDAVHELSRR